MRWCDERIPALGNRTPCQAIRTPAGRAQVEGLLREVEWNEQRQPAWKRVGMDTIRKTPGLGHPCRA